MGKVSHACFCVTNDQLLVEKMPQVVMNFASNKQTELAAGIAPVRILPGDQKVALVVASGQIYVSIIFPTPCSTLQIRYTILQIYSKGILRPE